MKTISIRDRVAGMLFRAWMLEMGLRYALADVRTYGLRDTLREYAAEVRNTVRWVQWGAALSGRAS